MVMDPLTAVGLASNIVQLVDAAAKGYVICREVYELGATIEDTRLTYTIDQLHQSYVVFDDVLKKEVITGSTILENRTPLGDLGSQCRQIAEELQTELQSLQKSPRGRISETISKLYLRKKKAKKIEKLKTRLDEHQKVLDSRIIIDLRQSLSALRSQTGKHDANIQHRLTEFSASLSSCHITVSRALKTEIDKAIEANADEHILTRKHIENHVAAGISNINALQNNAQNREKEERIKEQQCEQFLKSLTFDEMNLRKNEVQLAHSKTFDWIFDGDLQGRGQPWDNFAKWLKGAHPIYWLCGKAGSGKSTLIKYLAKNMKTRELLEERYPDTNVRIVTFYFWLSVSKLQRSFHGMLSSIIHQLLLDDTQVMNTILNDHKGLSRKRATHDWSKHELELLLRRILHLTFLPVCFFIDGLDEFDQGDDVEKLLTLIEEISNVSKVKTCVSSRPESYLSEHLNQYPHLRLQDLTRRDMRICIREELQRVWLNISTDFIDEECLWKIEETMIDKADGVFLWVHYVLSNLIRGLRNKDGFKDLLDRINDLPRGMHELYLQMWKRLNGDEQRYRDEATTYFSYVLMASEHDAKPPLDRISIFELLVALDESLQGRYVKTLAPQDSTALAASCERLKTRVITRCAGLLELKRDSDRDEDGDVSSSESVVSQNSSQSGQSDSLVIYSRTDIAFLHRTARDFLLDAEDGQQLLGNATMTPDLRLQNLVRAELAALIQESLQFHRRNIETIVRRVAYSGTQKQKDFISDIKRVCEILSMAKPPCDNINYREFWRSQYSIFDVEGIASFYGCVDYIRHYVCIEQYHVSPYYRGYLILCAAMGVIEHGFSGCLALMSWLGQGSSADLDTLHCVDHDIYHPAFHVLCALQDRKITRYENIAKQAAATLKVLLPSLLTSTKSHLIEFQFWAEEPRYEVEAWSRRRSMTLGQSNLGVYISPAKLCYYVMQRLEASVACGPKWSRPAYSGGDVSLVVGTSRLGRDSDNSWMFCVDGGDRSYLGEYVDHILFPNEHTSDWPDGPLKELERRIEEVCERSNEVPTIEWACDVGYNIPDGQSELVLDPTEDVDESNWMTIGHFRMPRGEPDWRWTYHGLPVPSSAFERQNAIKTES